LIYAATEPQGESGRDASAVAHVISGRKTIVTRAVLGSDAGLYGAAHMAVIAV